MTPNLFMMPWFPRDFMAATRGWPLISRAIYRELLDCQWEQGGLPDDAEALRALVGATPTEWRAGWRLVKPKFQRGQDGLLRNPRLEQHRQKAIRIAVTRSQVGRRGGFASATTRQANAEPNAQPFAEAKGQAKVNHQDNTTQDYGVRGLRRGETAELGSTTVPARAPPLRAKS
jgi:uncharacterized protein YdaU (DUF1376 family)